MKIPHDDSTNCKRQSWCEGPAWSDLGRRVNRCAMTPADRYEVTILGQKGQERRGDVSRHAGSDQTRADGSTEAP